MRKEGANESSLRRKRVAAKQTRGVAFNEKEGREIKGGGTGVGGAKPKGKTGSLERRDFRRCRLLLKG